MFAHFDHLGGLAALGSEDATDVFTAAELAAALPLGARLVFSMGCHTGLNVSDTLTGGELADDVAAALAARGAVYLATTGFGYGDEVSVGLHERLLTLFSAHLDGTMTIGAASVRAKQRYFGTQGLYGAYDEKALATTVLYGLPMWRIGADQTPEPPPAEQEPTPVAGTSLSSAPFDFSPQFIERSGATGNWFEVVDEGTTTFVPQVTPGRPLQPRFDADVTASDDATGELLPAHGALVTSLDVYDVVTGFDVAISEAVLDSAAGGVEDATNLAFPSRFASVTTFSDPTGPANADGLNQRQQVVVVPGRFVSDPAAATADIGTQTLFGTVAGEILYSNSSDYTPPHVPIAAGVVSPGDSTARFAVEAADPSGIVRAVVLYDAGAGWQSLELAFGDGRWQGSGPAPSTATSVRFIAQVVDGAGNVAVNGSKGFTNVGDDGELPPPPIESDLAVTVTPDVPASGWVTESPVVAATSSAAVLEVSVDGGPWEPVHGAGHGDRRRPAHGGVPRLARRRRLGRIRPRRHATDDRRVGRSGRRTVGLVDIDGHGVVHVRRRAVRRGRLPRHRRRRHRRCRSARDR